ncbi:MAG: integrase core domain-containing protein [Candidatus Rokuibacteriota bacterium]
MRIEEVLTAPLSPWQNPFAERLIGSIRRECLNHVLVRGERHLRRILTRLSFAKSSSDLVGTIRDPRVTAGGAPFGMSRETVRSATSMPSFKSFPWMRGAPHKGFAAAVFLTRVAISELMQGRPRIGRPESWAEYSRKRRRCHRRAVSGETMTRACLQLVQAPASPTQNRRSIVRSLGRGAVRL